MSNSVDLDVNPLQWVVSAFRSSTNLYIEIQNFQRMGKLPEIKGRNLLNELRDLNETLDALGKVFSPLKEVLDTSVFDFSKLENPLHTCGKACEDFKHQIEQSSSTSVWNNIRYWNGIQIMGDKVDHFQQLLCGYKMAFAIVIMDIDRRNDPAIAAHPGYKPLIKATRDKISALIQHNKDFLVARISPDATNEMSSLRSCLEFCDSAEAN
ncbi:hypothetical protein E8E15_000547 [Penicillium rubens]|nr:hypothetical protein E8E15_000547 [Penicillium rubens]